MIPDIYLNDSSMLSCGWLRESVDFPAPQPQNDILTVPGIDRGSVDARNARSF